MFKPFREGYVRWKRAEWKRHLEKWRLLRRSQHRCKAMTPVHTLRPDTDILDDLYARVLICDDGLSHQVIVSVDCCLTNETDFYSPNPDGQMEPYRKLLRTLWREGLRTIYSGCSRACWACKELNRHMACWQDLNLRMTSVMPRSQSAKRTLELGVEPCYL